MQRLFLFVLLIFIFDGSLLSAAIYKGYRVYVQECSKCHTDKQAFVKSKTIQEWSKLMANHGKPLKEIHLKNDKAKSSWNYFNTKKYTKKSKHLKEFLIEYAKDSGKVPAFN
jgi:hypothetical protein